jgi:hypothetical protein
MSGEFGLHSELRRQIVRRQQLPNLCQYHSIVELNCHGKRRRDFDNSPAGNAEGRSGRRRRWRSRDRGHSGQDDKCVAECGG